MGLSRCLSHSTLALNRGSGDLVAATSIVSYAISASKQRCRMPLSGFQGTAGSDYLEPGQEVQAGHWLPTRDLQHLCSVYWQWRPYLEGAHRGSRIHLASALLWLVRLLPDICSATLALRERAIGCSGVTHRATCRLHSLLYMFLAARLRTRDRGTSFVKYINDGVQNMC